MIVGILWPVSMIFFFLFFFILHLLGGEIQCAGQRQSFGSR